MNYVIRSRRHREAIKMRYYGVRYVMTVGADGQ